MYETEFEIAERQWAPFIAQLATVLGEARITVDDVLEAVKRDSTLRSLVPDDVRRKGDTYAPPRTWARCINRQTGIVRHGAALVSATTKGGQWYLTKDPT